MFLLDGSIGYCHKMGKEGREGVDLLDIPTLSFSLSLSNFSPVLSLSIPTTEGPREEEERSGGRTQTFYRSTTPC